MLRSFHERCSGGGGERRSTFTPRDLRVRARACTSRVTRPPAWPARFGVYLWCESPFDTRISPGQSGCRRRKVSSRKRLASKRLLNTDQNRAGTAGTKRLTHGALAVTFVPFRCGILDLCRVRPVLAFEGRATTGGLFDQRDRIPQRPSRACPRALLRRASSAQMLAPRDPRTRPHRPRTPTLGHALETALDAFALMFESRIFRNAK